jgi:hypothetical protein
MSNVEELLDELASQSSPVRTLRLPRRFHPSYLASTSKDAVGRTEEWLKRCTVRVVEVIWRLVAETEEDDASINEEF